MLHHTISNVDFMSLLVDTHQSVNSQDDSSVTKVIPMIKMLFPQSFHSVQRGTFPDYGRRIEINSRAVFSRHL